MDELFDLLNDSDDDETPAVTRDPVRDEDPVGAGMDELLELMNNNDEEDEEHDTDYRGHKNAPAQAQTIPKHRGHTTTTSRAGNDVRQRPLAASSSSSSSSSTTATTHMTATHSQHSQPRTKHAPQESVDDRLDIRMKHRLVSSSDLLELITDYGYLSPSVLSAMPLKKLNALLRDPAAVLDPATVGGITESLVTVGVVFSNSGTRISGKGGNAFCVITLGNLYAGPCLTVFLFGAAYGKYCVSCKPGKVIALLMPKLLPAGQNNNNNKNAAAADRTVSFSVSEPDQLRIVATARDYAICKFQACKHYVDLRKSELCDRCRKRKGGGKPNAPNKFQQARADHRQASAILVPSRNKPGLTGTNGAAKNKPNRFLDRTNTTPAAAGNTSAAKGRSNIPLHMSKTAAPNRSFSVAEQQKSKNKYLNASRGTSSGTRSSENSSTNERNTNKFLHASRGSSSGTRSSETVGSTNERNSKNKYLQTSASNPYQKTIPPKRADSGKDTTVSTAEKASNKPKKVNGNWLEDARSLSKERGPANLRSGRIGFSLAHFTKTKQRSAINNTENTRAAAATSTAPPKKKPRVLHTDGASFDGSVSIPKPNQLLFQPSSGGACGEAAPARRLVTPQSKSRHELLQQQARVAQRMKESSSLRKPPETSLRNSAGKGLILGKGRIRAPSAKQPRNSQKSKTPTEVNDFLAAMGGEFDEEIVRNAKSRFANEVEADEYARHRHKVVELEKLEASQESRNKKRNPEQQSRRMTKTWYCQTCQRGYSFRPKGCYTKNHSVKASIELKDAVTKAERRNELQKKSIEDGGLRIGSGIDWGTSRYNRMG